MKTTQSIGVFTFVLAIAFALAACGGGGGDLTIDLTGTIAISPPTATVGTVLTANYSGIETVDYQWKKDGTAISNARSRTFTPDSAGNHTVTISAVGYNSKTSAAITVTPKEDPCCDLAERTEVNCINFGKLFEETPDQDGVSYRLRKTIGPGLLAQSETLKNMYGNVFSEFGNIISMAENAIYSQYRDRGADAADVVCHAGSYHDNIATALTNLSDNPELFGARLQAFRTVSYMNQRNVGDKGANRAGELEALLQQIESLSGTVVPRIDDNVKYDNTFNRLMTDLINTVPESAGTGRYLLLQQLMEFAKLHGWTKDVQELGLEPTKYGDETSWKVSKAENVQGTERLAQFIIELPQNVQSRTQGISYRICLVSLCDMVRYM